MTVRQTRYHLTEAAPQIRAESDLPPGIAGRVSGVALTYEPGYGIVRNGCTLGGPHSNAVEYRGADRFVAEAAVYPRGSAFSYERR